MTSFKQQVSAYVILINYDSYFFRGSKCSFRTELLLELAEKELAEKELELAENAGHELVHFVSSRHEIFFNLNNNPLLKL